MQWFKRLDANDIMTVRRMVAAGDSQKVVAERLGLGRPTVNRICRGVAHPELPLIPYTPYHHTGPVKMRRGLRADALRKRLNVVPVK
jgi:hypothetical protein